MNRLGGHNGFLVQHLKSVDHSVFTPEELKEFKEFTRDAKLYKAGSVGMFIPAFVLTIFISETMLGLILALPLFYFAYRWWEISDGRAGVALRIYNDASKRKNI